MLTTYTIYFLLGTLICLAVGQGERKRIFKLWAFVYTVYYLYTYLACSYVRNPLLDYFVSPDEVTFFDISLSLSKYSFQDIWRHAFSGPEYGELPFAAAWFGSIHKISYILGVTDNLLFIKTSVCLIGSFIPVIIYKLLCLEGYGDNKDCVRSILLFAFLTPLFSYSCQYLRDIHVCFIYTLMFYLVVKENVKGRYVYLVLLFLISYALRIETGLFSALFIFLSIYLHNTNSSKVSRLFLFIGVAVIILFSYTYVMNVMNETIENYTERSIEMADQGSLGVKLNALPVPLNYISKMLFAQLLPFPIWMPVTSSYPYDVMRVVECSFPLYWVTILFVLGYYVVKKATHLDQTFKIVMLFCIAYLLLASMSEFNSRRLMAVYPIMFTVYYKIKVDKHYRIRPFFLYSLFMLLVLHIVYSIIK